MSRLVFLDLETTGLDPREADVWEFAAIVRDEDGTETEYHRFVRHDTLLAASLPESYRKDHDERYDESAAIGSRALAELVQDITKDKARIVGAAPWFDAAFLASYVSLLDEKPHWSHRLIDVETLAAGDAGRLMDGLKDAAKYAGVENPAAHTAMGDARTAKAVYDFVMGGQA